MTLFELLASGTAGSAITGFLAFLTRRAEMGRINAEIEQLKATAEMTEAQADDLVSARLIRELDRIAANNQELAGMVQRQALEIDKLRREVIRYEAREHRHRLEKDILWQELLKFNEVDSPFMLAIRAKFPILDELDPPVVSENTR